MTVESIITACVTAGVTLLVCLINNNHQNNSTRMLLEYRLKKLEEKVDKHNNIVERTYKLEEQSALHEEKIRVANHRIEDLEEKVV